MNKLTKNQLQVCWRALLVAMHTCLVIAVSPAQKIVNSEEAASRMNAYLRTFALSGEIQASKVAYVDEPGAEPPRYSYNGNDYWIVLDAEDGSIAGLYNCKLESERATKPLPKEAFVIKTAEQAEEMAWQVLRKMDGRKIPWVVSAVKAYGLNSDSNGKSETRGRITVQFAETVEGAKGVVNSAGIDLDAVTGQILNCGQADKSHYSRPSSTISKAEAISKAKAIFDRQRSRANESQFHWWDWPSDEEVARTTCLELNGPSGRDFQGNIVEIYGSRFAGELAQREPLGVRLTWSILIPSTDNVLILDAESGEPMQELLVSKALKPTSMDNTKNFASGNVSPPQGSSKKSETRAPAVWLAVGLISLVGSIFGTRSWLLRQVKGRTQKL